MARYDNPPTSVSAGQQTINTTPTGLNDGDPLACQEVLVVNLPASSSTVVIGSADARFLDLTPGASLPIPIDDVSKIVCATASGTATVQWLVTA